MRLTDVFHRAHYETIDSDDETVRGLPPPSSTPAAVSVISGMAAGAVVGSIAGPEGLIVGAVLGSAIFVAATIALDAENAENQQKDEALDRAIGVFGGDLGAAGPNQPPVRIGAFSTASMGITSESVVEPSEGPISSAENN
jgi:hypothetical protein